MLMLARYARSAATKESLARFRWWRPEHGWPLTVTSLIVEFIDEIGHFRVTLCPCLKTSPRGKPFIKK